MMQNDNQEFVSVPSDTDPWYVGPDADDEYAREHFDAHGFYPDWRDSFHDFTLNDQDGGDYLTITRR